MEEDIKSKENIGEYGWIDFDSWKYEKYFKEYCEIKFKQQLIFGTSQSSKDDFENFVKEKENNDRNYTR